MVTCVTGNVVLVAAKALTNRQVYSLPPFLLQNESLTTFGSIYKSAG